MKGATAGPGSGEASRCEGSAGWEKHGLPTFSTDPEERLGQGLTSQQEKAREKVLLKPGFIILDLRAVGAFSTPGLSRRTEAAVL